MSAVEQVKKMWTKEMWTRARDTHKSAFSHGISTLMGMGSVINQTHISNEIHSRKFAKEVKKSFGSTHIFESLLTRCLLANWRRGEKECRLWVEAWVACPNLCPHCHGRVQLPWNFARLQHTHHTWETRFLYQKLKHNGGYHRRECARENEIGREVEAYTGLQRHCCHQL